MELFEKTLSETYKYKGKIVNLRVDEVELPNGHISIREVVEHNGGVCVLAVTEQGEVLLVRQFRYPYKEVLWELPAGKLEKGEDPQEAGMRELEEETGYTAKELKSLGKLYPTPGYCAEVIHLYLACGLEKTEQRLDEDEFLDVSPLPLSQVKEMIVNGEIKNAAAQTAVLKYLFLYGEKGPLR